MTVKRAWVAVCLGQFLFAMVAGAAVDPRVQRSERHFESYLKENLEPYTTGKKRIYRGRIRITNLKTHETWIDDVNGTAGNSSHLSVVLTTTPPNPSQKLPLMEFEIYQPYPTEVALFRFTIRPFHGNHGHVPVWDKNAFQEMELLTDTRPDFPNLLIKRFTTRTPLVADFGAYDNHSFEGSVAILDPGVVTLKDILSTPQAMVSGVRENDLLNQQASGNLVLVADIGRLTTTVTMFLPYEEVVLVDPKLPPCYDNKPYTFKYVGKAVIAPNTTPLKTSTGAFSDLKCRQ